MAILFSEPPKPGACPSGRSKDRYEEIILTMVAGRDLDLNQDSYSYKFNAESTVSSTHLSVSWSQLLKLNQ